MTFPDDDSREIIDNLPLPTSVVKSQPPSFVLDFLGLNTVPVQNVGFDAATLIFVSQIFAGLIELGAAGTAGAGCYIAGQKRSKLKERYPSDVSLSPVADLKAIVSGRGTTVPRFLVVFYEAPFGKINCFWPWMIKVTVGDVSKYSSLIDVEPHFTTYTKRFKSVKDVSENIIKQLFGLVPNDYVLETDSWCSGNKSGLFSF